MGTVEDINMADTSNSTGDTGSNLANTIRGLKKFDGTNPADLKGWMKKLCVVLGVTRRNILPLLKDQPKPATTDTAAFATYTRENEDLYAMLYLLVELQAAPSVQKHEDDTEISGDGQAAFKELCNNYNRVTDEVIRATMEELVNTQMEPGQNPDDYFNQKHLLRHRAEKMGEVVSDCWFKDICIEGFTDDYKDVKMMVYRDPTFDISQMQSTMRHIFIGEQSRNGAKGRIAGRGIAMTTTTFTDHRTCFICKEQGHVRRNCPRNKGKQDNDPMETKSGGTGKFCSVHKSTTHSDEECWTQGAKRKAKAKAFSACTRCTHCSAGKRHDTEQAAITEKPTINFTGSNDEFDGGFMFATTCKAGREFTPDPDHATLLIDSGASNTFLDPRIVPGLKDKMREYKDLETPKPIETAGDHTLHGIGTGIVH